MGWGERIKATVVGSSALLLAGCNLGAWFHRHDATASAAIPSARSQVRPLSAPEDSKTLPRLTARGQGAHDARRDFDDLWDRVRVGLRLADATHPEVQQEVLWFQRNQEFLQRSLERARPYLYYIVEQFDERGMPLDLALLPVLESGFQPTAHSPNRAAGIWQFIPSTGRRFGLKQNSWYDGRLDVIASTRAALDYLQRLHDEMDGDWLNAVAAYNCGEKKLLQAIAQNRRRGRRTDFWSLDLPQETKGYVPRLLALSSIVQSPLRYGVALAAIPNRPVVATVNLGRQVDLAKVAAVAGLPLDDLRRLNPGFLRRITDPAGPHELLLPVAAVESVRRAAGRSSDLQAETLSHRVRKGERLADIARRYGVSAADILSANALSGPRLKAGQELVIPAVAKTAPAASGGGDRALLHTVQAGDSLWSIARRYGVNVASLARWNGIDPGSVLGLEQQLIVYPESRGEPEPASPAPELAQASPSGPEIRLVRYEVKDGDSLWRIARHFGVSVEQLCLWNRMPRHAVLQPGDNLDVYVGLNEVRDPGLQI